MQAMVHGTELLAKGHMVKACHFRLAPEKQETVPMHIRAELFDCACVSDGIPQVVADHASAKGATFQLLHVVVAGRLGHAANSDMSAATSEASPAKRAN